MPEIIFAVPGDIETPTGGYAYDRRLLQELLTQGMAVRHLQLPGSFPLATVPDLGEAGYLLKMTPDDSIIMVDGLAFGSLTELVLKDIERTFVALVHHPLAMEEGLGPRRRRAFHASEKAALARAAHVVVTSPTTARLLAGDYGVPESRITIAEPGTDPAPRAKGSGNGRLHLLCVGSVLPRKGYRVLVEALTPLVGFDWACTIVGSVDRDPAEAEAVRHAIASAGFEGRIRLVGAQTPGQLGAHYDRADLFVMPSLYEGYGMAPAEALARGLPIVCTTGGALAETVPDEAALKVAPGDAAALAEALRDALGDAGLRRRLADAAWRAGKALPRWSDTAARVAGALHGVIAARQVVRS